MPSSTSIAALEQRLEALRKSDHSAADQAIGLAVCEEAIEAAREGNYGVGALLVDPQGKVVARERNRAFYPYFRSDQHAEMRALNTFEEQVPHSGPMRKFTMITSLEPCPMCLARILISGVEVVKFISHDELGGMVTRLDALPEAWQRLRKRQRFELADVSEDLRKLATDVFELNLDSLREKLWAR